MSFKTLLIGWDAADWKIILPLIDTGKLPNFQKLTEQGVIGRLAGIQPDDSSAIWTSIVTGKYPHQHQILADYEILPQTRNIAPISNLARKGKALWNILQQNGYRCQVIGWPTTHPVEPLNGAMISQFFAKPPAANVKTWLVQSGMVHPPELQANLAALRVHPTDLQRDDLLPFIPQFDELYQANDPRLVALALSLAETASIQAVATELMLNQEWDFTAVYFNGLAQISQHFMNYHPPRPDFVSEQDFEYFQGTVEMAYIFHDIMLGVLMQLAGDKANILLLSPQGFHSGTSRNNEEPGTLPEHKELGMLAWRANGIKSDSLIYQTAVLDIVPTILHQYGLPVGRDMAGKILHNAFTEPSEPIWIDSWDNDEVEESAQRYNPLATIDIVESTDPKQQLIQGLINDLHFKRAKSFLSSGCEHKAIPIIEAIWAADPTDSRCGNLLMNCYITIERTDLARQSFERMLALKKQQAPAALKAWKILEAKDSLTLAERKQKPKLWKQSRINLSGMAYLNAWLLRAEGKPKEALLAAERADENKVYNRIGLYKLKAECLMELNRLLEAKVEYEKVLAIDPDSSDAWLGLARVDFEQKKFQSAADKAATCIGLRYLSPRAHFLYGVSMYRLGEPQKAADALKISAIQAPGHSMAACQRLALLYNGPLNDPKQAAYYTTQAEQVLTQNKNVKAQRQAGFDIESEDF